VEAEDDSKVEAVEVADVACTVAALTADELFTTERTHNLQTTRISNRFVDSTFISDSKT